MQRSTRPYVEPQINTDGCEIVRQVSKSQGKFKIVTIDFTMHLEVWLARVTDGGAGFRIISDVEEIAGILMSHVVTPDDGSGGAND